MNVIIPTLGQYGLIADQPPQELPINAWSDCENMRFRGGCAERIGGHVQVFATPTVTPLYIVPYQSGAATRFWVHIGEASAFADDGTTRTDITGTPFTGDADDQWSAAVHGGVLIVTNKVDEPVFWGGDTAQNFATFTGWDSDYRCGSLASFKNHIIAVDIVKNGEALRHTVKWSAPSEPGTMPTSWDHTNETTFAGEVPLGETTDGIIDQLVLGDANLIYKERSIYAMRYIGGTNIFEFRRVPGNWGMLTKGCACVTPVGHFVLANGDVVIVDGINEPRSILTDRAKNWLFNTQIDSVAYEKCFVVAHPSLSEAWVCYPEVGQSVCTKALTWNWDSNTFGTRDLPNINHAASGLLDYTTGNTWDSDADTWDDDDSAWNQDEFSPSAPRLLMASDDDLILQADTGASFNGTGIPAVIERTGMAFDDPDSFKLLRSITPRVDAPAGTVLMISAGGSEDAEVAPNYGTPVTYTVGSTRKADLFASGRFIALKIQSASGPKWRIKSITVDVQPMGPF